MPSCYPEFLSKYPGELCSHYSPKLALPSGSMQPIRPHLTVSIISSEFGQRMPGQLLFLETSPSPVAHVTRYITPLLPQGPFRRTPRDLTSRMELRFADSSGICEKMERSTVAGSAPFAFVPCQASGAVSVEKRKDGQHSL